MFKTIGIQSVATIVAALFAGWWFNSVIATSILLGGAAAVIPNGLFALRLASHQNKSAESYPVVFYLGEFAKIGFTVAAIVAAYRWIPDVNGTALLVGLIVALKAPLFAFFLTLIFERKNGLQY